MIVEKEHRRLQSDQRVVILRVEGLIKLGESSEFFVSAVQVLEGQTIIVDLSNVDYIDSTGIGEFVGSCVALARAGQKLALMHVSERIANLLGLAHAGEDLTVLTVEEAAEYAPSPKVSKQTGQETEQGPPTQTRVVTVRDTRSEHGSSGSSASMKQMRIITFHGNLQQIAFRFFPWRIALRIGLKGWVQDMPDGKTVMACVEGEQSAIEVWLSDVRDGPFGYYVTRIEQELMDFSGKFDNFDRGS